MANAPIKLHIVWILKTGTSDPRTGAKTLLNINLYQLTEGLNTAREENVTYFIAITLAPHSWADYLTQPKSSRYKS